MCENAIFGLHDYGEYTKLISSQLKDMSVGDIRQVDSHGESREKFRATVHHVASKTKAKYATKYIRGEGFFVKRKA